MRRWQVKVEGKHTGVHNAPFRRWRKKTALADVSALRWSAWRMNADLEYFVVDRWTGKVVL